MIDKKEYPEHYEIVDNHLSKFFADKDISVFHEMPTIDFHLDVYYVRSNQCEFDFLLTSGMSAFAMDTSEIGENAADYRFTELVTVLPKSAELSNFFPGTSEYDWVLTMMKQCAKFPYLNNTWIGIGHTIQASEDLETYSDQTGYCGCVVLPSVSFPEDFLTIPSPDGNINIYGLFPLYKEELKFKIEKGYNEFIKLLSKNDATEIIKPGRKNYCLNPGNWFTKLFD